MATSDHEQMHMLPTPTPTSSLPALPTAPRRMRWLAWGTLAMCTLTLVVLASVASTPIAWQSAAAQHLPRLHFIQQHPAVTTTTTDVAQSALAPRPQLATGEKGIVLCLHDGIAAMGASLIRELRCVGNTEVVQVYHCFPDELSAASRALLTRHDPRVEIIDVCTALLDDPTVLQGNHKLAATFRSYWIKPLALYHTRLDEVLLLDADVVLLRDPAVLRTTSTGYNRTGTIFFHDRVAFMRKFFNTKLANGKQMLHHILDTFNYTQFGLAKPQRPSSTMRASFAYKEETGHEMDSSMVFVNKRRAGKALEVLRYLMTELRFKMKFSWGDKEAFWLAFELAQQPYFFSPYGLSLVDSVPNDDLTQHPDTLCGSMAHFVPTEDADEVHKLLYVNGKALLDPFAVGMEKLGTVARSRLFNVNPTRVTPRYKYSEFDVASRKTFECMDNLGSTPLPDAFRVHLLRRRHHFFAAQTGVLEALDRCDV